MGGIIVTMETATKQDIARVENKIDSSIARVEKDIERLERKIDSSFEDITSLIRDFMQQASERFDDQDKKYNRLIDTIDGFISRIDRYETELAARDSQFEKLLAWARKVSEKTGIPLENL